MAGLDPAMRFPSLGDHPLGKVRGFMGLLLHQKSPILAVRRNAWGGGPKARIKARRMRSGSPKPVQAATASIGSAPLSTCSRAASSRSRSISLAGVVPVSAATRLMPNLFLRVHVLRRVRRGGAVQCLPELRRVCAASDPTGRRAATGSLHWKTTGGGKTGPPEMVPRRDRRIREAGARYSLREPLSHRPPCCAT